MDGIWVEMYSVDQVFCDDERDKGWLLNMLGWRLCAMLPGPLDCCCGAMGIGRGIGCVGGAEEEEEVATMSRAHDPLPAGPGYDCECAVSAGAGAGGMTVCGGPPRGEPVLGPAAMELEMSWCRRTR